MASMENPHTQLFANSVASENVPPGRIYFLDHDFLALYGATLERMALGLSLEIPEPEDW